MSVKHLIFDIDGTIWDTTPLVAEAYNDAVEEAIGERPSITADVLREQFGKPMMVIAENLFPGRSTEEHRRIVDLCGVHEARVLRGTTKDLTYPGLRDAFRELTEMGCRVYIVSNCQVGYIELCMEKNGLEPYVTDHLCHGETGRSKGENIGELMRRNGIEEAVYVGDTMGDCEAAAEAGVPFWHACYGFGDAPGEVQLESPAQIVETVRRS